MYLSAKKLEETTLELLYVPGSKRRNMPTVLLKVNSKMGVGEVGEWRCRTGSLWLLQSYKLKILELFWFRRCYMHTFFAKQLRWEGRRGGATGPILPLTCFYDKSGFSLFLSGSYRFFFVFFWYVQQQRKILAKFGKSLEQTILLKKPCAVYTHQLFKKCRLVLKRRLYCSLFKD